MTGATAGSAASCRHGLFRLRCQGAEFRMTFLQDQETSSVGYE